MTKFEEKEFLAGLKEVWVKVGKRYKLDLMNPTLENFREELIKRFKYPPIIDEFGYGGALDEFERDLSKTLKNSDVRFLIQDILSDDRRTKFLESIKTTEKPDRKRRHRKNFERQVRLVEFVLERHVIYNNLLEGPGPITKRIAEWGKLTDEWNEFHPYDSMTFTTLRQNYHNAIKEDDVIQACREKARYEILEHTRLLCEGPPSIHPYQPGNPNIDKKTTELLERTMAFFEAPEATYELAQEHDKAFAALQQAYLDEAKGDK